jgi:hypothetical protein
MNRTKDPEESFGHPGLRRVDDLGAQLIDESGAKGKPVRIAGAGTEHKDRRSRIIH